MGLGLGLALVLFACFSWQENIGPKASRKLRNTRSNHIIVVSGSVDSELVVDMNQRLRKLYLVDGDNCVFQVLDSAVIGTREVVCANLKNCTLMFDEIDVRVLRVVDCQNFTIQVRCCCGISF